jgi:hypothetical protein
VRGKCKIKCLHDGGQNNLGSEAVESVTFNKDGLRDSDEFERGDGGAGGELS